MLYFKNSFIIRKRFDFVTKEKKAVFFLKYYSSLYFKKIFLFYLNNYSKKLLHHYAVFSLNFIKFFIIFLSRKYVKSLKNTTKIDLIVYSFLLELSKNFIKTLNFNLIDISNKRFNVFNTVKSINLLLNEVYYNTFVLFNNKTLNLEDLINVFLIRYSTINSNNKGIFFDINNLYYRLILKDLYLNNINTLVLKDDEKELYFNSKVVSIKSISYSLKDFIYFYYYLILNTYRNNEFFFFFIK